MELRHLRYFLCVAQELHFGRAALRLGISQPPLSQQIRVLESELGVRLFERTSRRVRLTEVGALFLPEAQQVIDQAERAMDTARRAQRGELGRLRLGFTTSAPFVPQIAASLYAFRQRQPDVALTLQELSRDEQIAHLEQGLLDLGIVRGFDPPDLPPSFSCTCLLEDAMMVGMRDDHPLAATSGAIPLRALIAENFVLYQVAIGAGFNDHLFDLCRAEGFMPRISHEAGGLATLLGLVSAGFGVTVLGESLTRLHLENVVYRRLAGTKSINRLWLIHDNRPSATRQTFIDSIATNAS